MLTNLTNCAVSGAFFILLSIGFVCGQVHLVNQTHPGAFTALALSDDGELLVTAGTDHTIRLWTTNNAREIMRRPTPKDPVTAVALVEHKRWLVVGYSSGLMTRKDLISQTNSRSALVTG